MNNPPTNQNDIPTPRTDAAVIQKDYPLFCGSPLIEIVPADFARTLERENVHIEMDNARLLKQHDDLQSQLAEARECVLGLREALRTSESWPLADLLVILQGATSHLLHHHNCDCHGHEAWSNAIKLVNDSIARLNYAISTSPTDLSKRWVARDVLEKCVEAITCAGYALTHKDSNQSFAIAACEDSLAAAQSELAKGETK